MNKIIIVINGIGTSGKDTFVEYVSKYAKVFNFSQVDKVKEIARMIGWDGSKDEKSRNFLADLKKLITDYNDMAFADTVEKVNMFKDDDNEIMFIHTREPENIKKLVNKFNAYSLLVKRVGLKDLSDSRVDSDFFVENYNYDIIIENDTLENLDIKAKELVDKFSKRTRKMKWI